MPQKNAGQMTIETIERQREYVKEQKKKGKTLGIVFADAFLRGMRDIGYKSPAWALAEEADNSFQAGASTFSIRVGFAAGETNGAKPGQAGVLAGGEGQRPAKTRPAGRLSGHDP